MSNILMEIIATIGGFLILLLVFIFKNYRDELEYKREQNIAENEALRKQNEEEHKALRKQDEALFEAIEQVKLSANADKEETNIRIQSMELMLVKEKVSNKIRLENLERTQ